MKKFHQFLSPVIAAFALIATAGVQAQTMQADEAALRNIEEVWGQATESRDIPTLSRLLDDDFVQVTIAGQRRTKNDLLDAPPLPAGSTQKMTITQVHVAGDVAIVDGAIRFKLTKNSKPMRVRFKDGFKRYAGGWRVISSSMTLE